MAAEKWRRRGVFATSIGIKDAAGGVNASVLGIINSGGTLALSANGTARDTAGTVLLDLTTSRVRVPVQGTTVGTASAGLGPNNGGSAGALKAGNSASQAMIGITIGGTVYQLAWATGGGSVHVTANPAGV